MADVAELPRVEWVPGQQPLPGLDVADLRLDDDARVVTLPPLERYL